MMAAFAVSLLLLATGAFPQGSTNGMGSVQGIVLDGDGKALPGAIVYSAEDIRNRGLRVATDEAGRFTLKCVSTGPVNLHAYKESDGYPDDFFAFYEMPGEREARSTLASWRHARR
jgi:hypothetical protein